MGKNRYMMFRNKRFIGKLWANIERNTEYLYTNSSLN